MAKQVKKELIMRNELRVLKKKIVTVLGTYYGAITYHNCQHMQNA